MRVIVVGGGINGYSCAVQILEHFTKTKNSQIDVTIQSELFSPNTTGDGSAGLWGPYLLGSTPQEKIYKWSKGMHDFLEKLWLSEDAGEAGVCLIPTTRIATNAEHIESFWKDIVYGARSLSQAELDEYSKLANKKLVIGTQFVTYTSEPVKLLPYLMKRFEANGGKTIQKKIDNLTQFIENSPYDVYINCTGLGSREALGDKQMYPVRGQVSRVKANWLYHAILDEGEGGNYIIPNADSVVLGGTMQRDDCIEVSESDKKFIVEGCRKYVPALKHSTHLFDWVGLRPGRDCLRLEAERIGSKTVIHNYGHGGAGVTLSWGCGEEVLELLKKEIARKNVLSRSKL